MAAAKKATAYKVVGPVVVIRKAKYERYVNRGVIVPAELLDEENAAHLLRVKLIEAYEAPAEEADPEGDKGEQTK